jgi:hypothetical protein
MKLIGNDLISHDPDFRNDRLSKRRESGEMQKIMFEIHLKHVYLIFNSLNSAHLVFSLFK